MLGSRSSSPLKAMPAAGKLASLSNEDMAVDEGLGYPKAFAKICRGRTVLSPYSQGPPFVFIPYTLQPQEALRAKESNQMFPIVDPEAIPSVNPRGFVNLLWKQLDHLGNAGFDPDYFRVDPYGNVLYLHADLASPLAWDIDHWFPCSRGGLTVPSNLRLLQWQVCKKKHNKLEFLIPWWDLQLGISVNQFLSIFASKNSDFRNRGFSFLFPSGTSEEWNPLQAVDSHTFPHHFLEMKRQVGLAPAAIVSSSRNSDASVLKPLDLNSFHRPSIAAARKFHAEEDDPGRLAIQSFKLNASKENKNSNIDNHGSNTYLQIALARDSLRQMEESKKKHSEMSRLDDELNELKKSNETDRAALQELETLLIKKRRRVEKCRRLAEAQSSYKSLLEKMIRDAMHQSVVYKEQARLNQAATSALMARLEAQRAICDSSENELRRKFKQRDEIEKQIRPIWELRKRSRMDDTLFEEGHNENIKFLSRRRMRNPLKKELRLFLEEEQKASEASLYRGEDREEESDETSTSDSGENGVHKSSDFHEDSVAHKEKCSDLGIIKDSNNSLPQEEQSFSPGWMDEQELEVSNQKLKQLAIGECCKINELMQENSPCQNSGEGRRHRIHGIAKSHNDMQKELVESESSYISKMDGEIMEKPSEDDEYRMQLGKGNIDKWLHLLLKEAHEGGGSSNSAPVDSWSNNKDQTICKINHMKDEIKFLRLKPLEEDVNGPELDIQKTITSKSNGSRSNKTLSNSGFSEGGNSAIGVDSSTVSEGFSASRKSFVVKQREENKIGFPTPNSESSRGFRSLPSSPSMILGMRKGVDCIGKMPKVTGDDGDKEGGSSVRPNNHFIKTYTAKQSKKQ